MTLRVPRGYGVKRPYYQEICEGVRITPQNMPLTAWTGLPAVSVDERFHDPIVIAAGTAVGIAMSGDYAGTVMPASQASYTPSAYTNQDTDWGLPSSYSAYKEAPKPIGVVYQPVYSFWLKQQYTNYERSYYVPIVTDYVIQIPAVWSGEFEINPGDMVQVCAGTAYGGAPSFTTAPAGRYVKFDPSAAITDPGSGNPVDVGDLATMDYVVGRCINVTNIATGGTASAYLVNDLDNVTVSSAVKREFGGLNKVNTVPGLGLAGTATKGIPGWLLGARANAAGTYRALTILIRL